MDKRVIKTKKAITNAFADLLAKEDLNSITITEIAIAADVNRKTIYNYYNGVYDILDDIENNIISSFDKVLTDLGVAINLQDSYRIFDTLTSVLSTNIDLYGRLMKISTNSNLVKKLVNHFQSEVKDVFVSKRFISEKDAPYIAQYVVTGIFAAYQYWFNSNREIALEEFSQNLAQLVNRGILKFAKN